MARAVITRRGGSWPRALAAATLSLGCGAPPTQGTAPASSGADAGVRDAPSPPSDAGEPPIDPLDAEAEVAASALGRTIAWLDPEARALLVVRGGLPDEEVVTSIWALPPNVHDLLRVLADLHWAIDMADLPHVRDALSGAALVAQPALSRHPYLVLATKVDTQTLLDELRVGTDEAHEGGLTIFEPQGAFPYKIVVLDRDHLAFVSARELGHGVGPLTAARDLPRSALMTDITKSFDDDPTLLVTTIAAGPMMHLRFSPLVGRARLTLRAPAPGEVDGELALELVEEEADAVATLLDATDDAEQNDLVRELGRRAAFWAEGPTIVRGRLQIPREEAAAVWKVAP